MSQSSGPAPSYAGERLGLPERGAGAVAGWQRRLLALIVDWFAAKLVAGLVVGSAVWTSNGVEQLWVFGVFIVEVTLLTALVGGSFGQLLFRICVVRLDRGRVTVVPALIRTLLICLVIPPLVFNRDQRGLHDLAVGTVAVRR